MKYLCVEEDVVRESKSTICKIPCHPFSCGSWLALAKPPHLFERFLHLFLKDLATLPFFKVLSHFSSSSPGKSLRAALQHKPIDQ